MTTTERNRRLAMLDATDFNRIERLVKEGWGSHSIHIETGVALRLINAVFAWVDRNAKKEG